MGFTVGVVTGAGGIIIVLVIPPFGITWWIAIVVWCGIMAFIDTVIENW